MSDNEFFSVNSIQYPPDMVGELAELAYKYNVSMSLTTGIVVSVSIGGIGGDVSVLIIDTNKSGDECLMYSRHGHRGDYAGLAELLEYVKQRIKALYKEAGV